MRVDLGQKEEKRQERKRDEKGEEEREKEIQAGRQGGLNQTSLCQVLCSAHNVHVNYLIFITVLRYDTYSLLTTATERKNAT